MIKHPNLFYEASLCILWKQYYTISVRKYGTHVPYFRICILYFGICVPYLRTENLYRRDKTFY